MKEETVVTLHGLWMAGPESVILRHKLRVHGFKVVEFSYSSTARPIKQNAASLNDFLAGLDAETVHLVGHSLGGLVIVRLFEDFPQQKPGRVVCLGTPLRGSEAARGLARWPIGAMALGESLFALEGGPELWTAERDLGLIAGTQEIGLGRFVGELESPNDGTVSVAETRLPGATEHLCMPVSHTSMLVSEDVADQVAHFLREGTFIRD